MEASVWSEAALAEVCVYKGTPSSDPRAFAVPLAVPFVLWLSSVRTFGCRSVMGGGSAWQWAPSMQFRVLNRMGPFLSSTTSTGGQPTLNAVPSPEARMLAFFFLRYLLLGGEGGCN